jgi:hypothetical protein
MEFHSSTVLTKITLEPFLSDLLEVDESVVQQEEAERSLDAVFVVFLPRRSFVPFPAPLLLQHVLVLLLDEALRNTVAFSWSAVGISPAATSFSKIHLRPSNRNGTMAVYGMQTPPMQQSAMVDDGGGGLVVVQ